MAAKKFNTVYELLKDKKRWCKGVFAKNNRGKEVEITDGTAVKFCILGAIQKVYGEGKRADTKVSKLIHTIGPNDEGFLPLITVWNDGATHKTVLEAVEKAKI